MSQIASVVADLIGVSPEEKGADLLQKCVPGPYKAVQRQLEPDTFYVVSLNRLHNPWGLLIQVSWQRNAPKSHLRKEELRATAQMVAASQDAMAACLELVRGNGTPESLQRAIELAKYAIDRAEGRE